MSADSINPAVYSVDSKPFGSAYADWVARLQQWMVSLPNPNNPTTDTTGRNCALNQGGPVWFLTGTTGGSAERSCTIPQDKGILFPIMASECSYSENPNVKTVHDLVLCAQADVNRAANMYASIDGQQIRQLERYRVTSSLFDLNFPVNNIFGAKPGPTKSVFDGYFVFLHPLPPGQHELIFGGVTPGDPTTGTANFAIDAKYHLTIK